MLDLALKNLVKQSGQNKKFIKMRETALNDPTLHGEWIHLGRETQLRAVRKISELEALIKEAREDPKRRVRYLSTGIIDEVSDRNVRSRTIADSSSPRMTYPAHSEGALLGEDGPTDSRRES